MVDTITHTPNLVRGKYCFTIMDEYKDENGYIPVIIAEDDPYNYPMSGQGDHAQPWYWGTTFEGAQKIADEKNVEMGVSKERAIEIVGSSFRANEKLRARRRRNRP
jgi:hypothetical protein